MLTPITIRMNHMRSQEPFYAGFLLPDGRNAAFEHGGIAMIVPVVPFTNGLHAQDGQATVIAHVRTNREASAETLITELYERLSRMSAFELLTEYFDEDADAYLLLNEEDDDAPADPPYDEFGRNLR
ncbi:hypothetical protein [Paenibacillus ehimensis]|uniref:hypothetical protein n=1 Tax=Paenibacillus ehimensis TaxID=79264 RepID=UPI000FD96BE6|nr:hypothetical protein [Paenibacillus ehimensis]